MLTYFLNYFEDLATGVNMGVFDFDVVNRVSGSRIMRSWEDYGNWVRAERATLQQPSLFIELERLAADVRKARSSTA
jgi:hypothetical protein